MSLTRHGLAIALVALLLSLTACSSTPPPEKPTETPNDAAKLVFATQPVGGTADAPLTIQPVVMALDARGNVVTDSWAVLVLKITPGTGAADATLTGGTTITSLNGEFRFTGIGIDKAGVGYTLTATSGNLSATSAALDISPGAAAKLTFSVHPSGGLAGSQLKTQPQVTLLDRHENMVTTFQGSVTVGISSGSGPDGAKLNGTTSASVVNGIARFANLSIEKTGSRYRLTAKSEGLASAISHEFEITPGAPARLVFTQEPRLARATRPFFIQPRVKLEDAYGNTVVGAKVSVTLSITPGTGTPGAVLSGKVTSATGEFEDLLIDRPGNGYTLTATSSGLLPVTSPAFDVGKADEPLGIFGM